MRWPWPPSIRVPSEPTVQEAIAVVRQHKIDQEAGASATWKHLNGAQRDAWRRESSALCALVASIESVRLQRQLRSMTNRALLKSAQNLGTITQRDGVDCPTEVIERQRMLLEAWRSDGPTTESLAVTQSSEAAQAESGVGAMLLGLESLMSSDPQARRTHSSGATERDPTDATNWLMLAEAQMSNERLQPGGGLFGRGGFAASRFALAALRRGAVPHGTRPLPVRRSTTLPPCSLSVPISSKRA